MSYLLTHLTLVPEDEISAYQRNLPHQRAIRAAKSGQVLSQSASPVKINS